MSYYGGPSAVVNHILAHNFQLSNFQARSKSLLAHHLLSVRLRLSLKFLLMYLLCAQGRWKDRLSSSPAREVECSICHWSSWVKLIWGIERLRCVQSRPQNNLLFVFAAMGTVVVDPLSHCHDCLMCLAREEAASATSRMLSTIRERCWYLFGSSS